MGIVFGHQGFDDPYQAALRWVGVVETRGLCLLKLVVFKAPVVWMRCKQRDVEIDTKRQRYSGNESRS